MGVAHGITVLWYTVVSTECVETAVRLCGNMVTWTEKYRPRTFDDMVGQPRAVGVLKKDVVSGPHGAYIFSGQYGGGKTTAARVFTAALMCPDRSEDGNPCGVCDTCRALSEGKFVSGVKEMNASEKNKVEDARKLIDDLNVGSLSKWQIVILDECHNITKPAWDTMLKTIENPPERTVFIMVTTDAGKIPDTIKSRSREIVFGAISDGAIADRLRHICDLEGESVDEAGIDRAVMSASGSMRSGIQALQNVIDGNFSGDTGSWESLVSAVKSRDVKGMLVAGSELSDGKIMSEAVVLERVFMLLSDSVVSGGLEKWTLGETLLAVREVAGGLRQLSSGGSKKVTLLSTLMLMCSPVEFNQSAAVSASVLSAVSDEVRRAVGSALSGVDWSAVPQGAVSGPNGVPPTQGPSEAVKSPERASGAVSGTVVGGPVVSGDSGESDDGQVVAEDGDDVRGDVKVSPVREGYEPALEKTARASEVMSGEALSEKAASKSQDPWVGMGDVQEWDAQSMTAWLDTLSPDNKSGVSEEEAKESVGDPWGGAVTSTGFRTDDDMVDALRTIKANADMELEPGNAVSVCCGSAVGVSRSEMVYLVDAEVDSAVIGEANSLLGDVTPYEVTFRSE